MTKITIDGNTAASHVAYAFSDVAAIYPITPSSPMAEIADEWGAAGRKNLFGQQIKIAEMQSEAGAAGAVHGSLVGGALTTTFTASQGLLLMIPNMYKIAGEMLPCVFHVSARALAAHALSIFGDHQDVMACRQTGFALLASNSVQEAMDLALVAHLSTLEAKVPFLHFFDGFRTSHEVSKIDAIDYADMAKLLKTEYVDEFRRRALNPEHPQLQGTAQNPDIYFQNREAANKYYMATPAIVEKYMKQVSKLTGREYHLFDYVGAPDADKVIILMGSGADAAEETVNYLTRRGEKVGVLKVRLYRPFSAERFVRALPKTVKKIAVLDRTKEAGSLGEPLYLDVVTALSETGKLRGKVVVGGRYGLGSKEFTPSMINAVYKNLDSEKPMNHFTVGINDDVTRTSLAIDEMIDVAPEGTTRCKFYGLGSDGTVGANKNSIKIIGDHTDLYAQGYFEYDSKKSGGITISHLRFGKSPIKSSYLIDQAEFIACHNSSYVTRYDMLGEAKEGGTFLLNCSWSDSELEKELPAFVKNQIAQKHLKFYTIDGLKIAKESGSAKSTNMVMQAAFFKLANIIPYEEAEKYMKAAVLKTYGKKGEKVVNANNAAIENAIKGLHEVKVPAEWATTDKGAALPEVTDNQYYESFIRPIIAQKGNTLPVSAFNVSGVVPTGTTKFEKRGIAVEVPVWQSENCIQCNQCSLVCPHACIRPVLIDENEKTPDGFVTKPATGVKGAKYRIQVSPLDCTGCGSCANVCPAKQKALVMTPADKVNETENWEFAEKVRQVESGLNKFSVKGSQFEQPLFEFSGACAGCGETPYVKLITQLFGDRMVIANATGCSSIYGGSAPTCPYTTNKDGHGPAWANSLFEDNAEFGFGINLAYLQRRNKVTDLLNQVLEIGTAKMKVAAKLWLDNKFDAEGSKKAAQAVKTEIIENARGKVRPIANELAKMEDCLVKKSVWIFGGDGWAYDIGYGGLDHVLASGEDVNVLVLDTEVYSNTGGQASKASPTGAVAKFAAAGKRIKKKDLGMMAMSYGYVYVAQVGMGANMNQLVKAVSEAEAYHGPSLIIAYAPCINHGIDMSNPQQIIKEAVDCGYWQLYRYNPALAEEGKNPFIMDSKEPTGSYQEFLRKETRYTSLLKTKPEIAEKLFERAEEEAKERVKKYQHLGQND
ncbi:MAG: pyruvate:ferredoxin (flavodoxin) oxidoreductase [Subdoligranulum sp.]|jgi:pyruvate synthase|nr:MAG: pyruvate:ferredoxin (flavodoxin) oxidoreductase [Subdoligranulum sp.]CDE71103.1 pyruvate-flavodoxin oxidoreductase [Subdoligranulum sp. CAG:314]